VKFANQDIKKQAFYIGLTLGAILLMINTLMLYFITITVHSLLIIAVVAPTILSYIIPFALIIVSCNLLRKRIGGYWNFKQAATGIFILFVSAYLVSVGGRVILFNVIDKGLDGKVKAAYITENAKVFNERHYPQSQVTTRVKDIKDMNFDGLGGNVTVAGITEGIVTIILILFAASLLFASFYKRELAVSPAKE